MQGFIETVFSILEDEDLTLGGKVARDLLQCLMNIVGNSTCQKYLRETAAGMHLIEAPIADLCGLFCIVVAACQDGAASLVSAISLAVTGKPSEEEDEEDERWDPRPCHWSWFHFR